MLTFSVSHPSEAGITCVILNLYIDPPWYPVDAVPASIGSTEDTLYFLDIRMGEASKLTPVCLSTLEKDTYNSPSFLSLKTSNISGSCWSVGLAGLAPSQVFLMRVNVCVPGLGMDAG